MDFFGQYTFLLAYFLFLSAIFSTQAWQPLVRELQRNKENKENKENEIFLSFYFSEIIFSTLGVIIAILLEKTFLNIFGYLGELPKIGILIIIFSQTNSFFGYFRYKNKHNLINIVQITQYSIILASCFFIGEINLNKFFIYIFLSYFISYAVGIYFILKTISIKTINIKEISLSSAFKICFPFYITILTDSPIRDLIVFIINKYFGAELVGFYRILTQIGNAYTKLTQPIYQASYSELVLVINKKQEHIVTSIIKKILITSALTLSIISAILIISYNLWIPIFFTSQYLIYYQYFIIYIIIQIIIGASVIINSAFLAIANGYEMFRCTAIINLLFIIFLYILISNLQFIGVFIAILIQVLMNISWKYIFLKSKEII